MGVLSFVAFIACGGAGDAPTAAPPEPVVERTVPEWSTEDMKAWEYAKAKGIHANEIRRRAAGEHTFLELTDRPEKIPPIHAGPPDIPSIWLVRSGDTLFELDDPAMAAVLMSTDALAVVNAYNQASLWMGAESIHGIEQTQQDGVTTLSWIHDRRTYPPSKLPNWQRVVLTATNDGVDTTRESLKGYTPPQ